MKAQSYPHYTPYETLRFERKDTTVSAPAAWWSSPSTSSAGTGAAAVTESHIIGTQSISQSTIPSMISPSQSILDSSFRSLSSSFTTLTYTTAFPTTVAQPSTTLTFTTQAVLISTLTTAFSPPSNQLAAQQQPVCIGNGLDAAADGIIATIVVPTAIGLVLWILFAILRPRYRQVYALREWFVPEQLRPKPLGSRLWAFLSPPVPFVSSIPTDMSDAGRSPSKDAKLFPSDEELTQRSLWICFLLVSGWTIVGLAGALPLYLVSTPCLAQSVPHAQFNGFYSTLQDLSVLRLLHLIDSGSITTSPASDASSRLSTREIVNGSDAFFRTRVRIIILIVLLIVVALFPALWKLLKEFNRAVAFRRRWIDVRCGAREMGWLSARDAPGFVGWGEKRFKDFLLKTGLSSSFATTTDVNGRSRRRRRQDIHEEDSNLEIDVQSLFSIGDTQRLALLIEERDEILENLEIAETRYISSFRLSTPDPSIADFQPRISTPPPMNETSNRPVISRPRALGNPRVRRGRRALNPAYAASSLAPTSFVAPSQYYKLRGVQGVSGGRFTAEDTLPTTSIPEPSFSDSVHSRVVGSRFHEVDRNSLAYGRLPLGSPLRLEKTGELGPASPTDGDSRRYWSGYGPNYDGRQHASGAEDPDEYGLRYRGSPVPEESGEDAHTNTHVHAQDDNDDDWVDLMREAPILFGADASDESTRAPPDLGSGSAGEHDYSTVNRRPPREETPSSGRRETFPLRSRGAGIEGEAPGPPHLRLQPQQPFVRPVSGLDHADLGRVYADISAWRARLKQVNAAIASAQADAYTDIADGARLRGWLLIGRGLRHVPGVTLIEGRAKEDVRWDVLQSERGWWDAVALWTFIVAMTLFLGAGLIAVAGLAVASAPDVAHYLPFFNSLSVHNNLATGIATALAPAVATILFVSINIAIIDWCIHLRGSVSITAAYFLAFKTTFFVLLAVGIALPAAGALLFGMHAFAGPAAGARARAVADGAVYMASLALAIVLSVAVATPALLMLQPVRLRSVLRAEREAVTPRQRFRALYPTTYNPTFATGACILGVVFASTFSLIFPLIGPAVVILLFLTLVAQRYLIGYVYARTHSQTGGLLHIWFIRRLAALTALQPLLLGLLVLSRRLYPEAGVLLGSGCLVVFSVEVYASWKLRGRRRRHLAQNTRDALGVFQAGARPKTRRSVDEESVLTSLVSTGAGTRARGSVASVLEMMSVTLAVMPPSAQSRGPVPLSTETLNDLTATERATRTHPDAPPRLPALTFSEPADDTAGLLYAPELVAPPPVIWLPNDAAGVARAEAIDLGRWHGLGVALDVRTREDVLGVGRRGAGPWGVGGGWNGRVSEVRARRGGGLWAAASEGL